MREISEKSLREKRLPYVKKNPKKRFTQTFFFHVKKKTLVYDEMTGKKKVNLGKSLFKFVMKF